MARLSKAEQYIDDDDEDAEGETDDDFDEKEVQAEDDANDESAESGAAQESEESEEEIIQRKPVRRSIGKAQARSRARGWRKRMTSESSDADDIGNSDDSAAATSESDDTAKPWEAGEDDAIDYRKMRADANDICVYCGQDEESDPADEYEEWLNCAVCGDNAHRQCARDHKSLALDQDTERWRCTSCITHGLEEDFKNVPAVLSRRRTSAPKMARDLLPSARGGINPESHSVFNTLILHEDPMDGSRSLRKRKTPLEDDYRSSDQKRQKSASVNGHDDDDDDDDAKSTTAEHDSPQSHSERPQRVKRLTKRSARIVSSSEHPKSLIIAIEANTAELEDAEKNAIKKQRRRERDRLRRIRNSRARTTTVEIDEPQTIPAVQLTMYTNPYYAFPDRENDELKGKPFGGILTEAEADTTRTYPQDPDREAFQDARDKAEEKWKEKMAANIETNPVGRPPKASGLPSKIKCINFGGFEIDTWHAAPYPEEYSRNKHLYICEFCLKYMSSDYVAWRHKLKCAAKHPPGDEIYRSKIMNPETGKETHLSFFEVDGRKNPLYCQNLCLLAKLFLGSKTLYYDVEPFLFYIMTEADEYGCHFVGYFSKEKRGCGPPSLISASTESVDADVNGKKYSPDAAAIEAALFNPGNNVSCILVLPVHMRRGFGRVLIEFSYLLTQVEGRTGSPEKPLSDMGLVSYRSYWRGVLCKLLLRYKDLDNNSTGTGPTSIARIARETGMTPDDIISTLESLRFLVRDPITRTYALRLDYEYMKEYVEKQEKKASIRLDPERLSWTPYVMGRPTTLIAMGEETVQPLSTVQPRAEESTIDEPDLRILEAQQIPETEDIAQSTEPPDTNGISSQDHAVESTNLAIHPADALGATPFSARQSPQKPLNSNLNSTMPDAASPDTSASDRPAHTGPIPPTRFEVFPPVPGMQSAARRKPGRPARGSNRRSYGTYRIGSGRRPGSGRRRGGARGRPPGRRPRSKLSEVVMTAVGNDDEPMPDADQVTTGAVYDHIVERNGHDKREEEEEEEGDDEEDAEGEEDGDGSGAFVQVRRPGDDDVDDDDSDDDSLETEED